MKRCIITGLLLTYLVATPAEADYIACRLEYRIWIHGMLILNTNNLPLLEQRVARDSDCLWIPGLVSAYIMYKSILDNNEDYICYGQLPEESEYQYILADC